MNKLAHIVAIITMSIWGVTFISTKTLLLNGLAPADIFFYRFVVAYLSTLMVCHGKWLADSWRDELLLMLVGLFGGSLYFLTENTSLVYAQASDVSIVVSCCPILVSVLLAIFYKNERLTVRQYVGIVIAFIGITLVVFNGHLVLHFSLLGYFLAFGAAFSWALYSLFMKGLTKRYTAWFINRKVFFYGILTILPYFLLVKPLNTDFSVLTRLPVAGNLLFLGVVANMFCYVLWTFVMVQIGSVRATAYIYLNPLFTIIFAKLFLDEQITFMVLVGTAILILGMILAERNKKQRRYE